MLTVIDRSKQLLASGRTGESISLLEAEIAGGGGGPGVHALLGYSYFQADRLADARTALTTGLRLFPFDATLHEAMARMRWLGGDGERFADDFLAAVAALPGDMLLRLKCADLLRLAAMPQAAERLLRDGLTRKPGDISIMAWLGVLLDETGRFDEALAMFRETVRAYPGEPTLRLNLSHVLMRMNRPQEAMPEISAVRAAHPDLNLALTYEGMVLKQLGDPKYAWLFDYQRHVQPYDIEAPKGFASTTEFNAALATRLRELQDAVDHPLEQSLRGGSQTSHNLTFDRDALLESYFAALDQPIRAYIATMGDDPAHPLEQRKRDRYKLSGCWSVLLRPGGFHVNHTHPNGWISSSYYVSLPASMSSDTREGWIKFGEPRWPTPGCGIERVVQPKEGRLVLFPSYMWHGTIPFSSGERLTAPFDVVPQ